MNKPKIYLPVTLLEALRAIESFRDAGTPGPWEVREHEGLVAIAGTGGWVQEDDVVPEIQDSRLIVLTQNILGELLEIVKIAYGNRFRCPSDLQVALDALRDKIQKQMLAPNMVAPNMVEEEPSEPAT